MFDPLYGTEVRVVDDDQDLVELLAYVISRTGASVRAATSAREALSLLSEWTPDIVLLDVGMPMMDGCELLREIRRRPLLRGVTAVAVTGQTHSIDRERAFEAGFDVHVAKPVDLMILIDLVEWLSSRRLPAAEFACGGEIVVYARFRGRSRAQGGEPAGSRLPWRLSDARPSAGGAPPMSR